MAARTRRSRAASRALVAPLFFAVPFGVVVVATLTRAKTAALPASATKASAATGARSADAWKKGERRIGTQCEAHAVTLSTWLATQRARAETAGRGERAAADQGQSDGGNDEAFSPLL